MLKRMAWGKARLFASVFALAVGAFCAAQAPRMSVQQVWSGLSQSQSNPYYANIENRGPDVNGILTTSSDREQTNVEYPVELPTGSKKRVLFQISAYNEGFIQLRIPSGTIEQPVKGDYNPEQIRIGLVSDNPSDLIFLKSQPTNSNGGDNAGIGVGGCTPDDAPDRLLGYECLDALVLGDGTDRLRDDQVHAIRQYIRSGGVVLFIGGAAPTAVSDQRWRDILPVENLQVVTKSGVTRTEGQTTANTKYVEVPNAKSYLRSYGLGLVSFLSVNPFESPIRESGDRKSMVLRSLPRFHRQQVVRMLDSQIGLEGNDYEGSYPPASSTVTGPAGSPPGSGLPPIARSLNQDPFQIKPPPVETIMYVLIAYIIVVIPINFFILRRMNRLERAWITTPIISVVFSAILLNSTISLYSAGATTRTKSIAVVDANGEGLAFARSEMFFPRASSYDLKLKGVETLMSESRYGNSLSTGVNLIDNGRNIIAPAVSTGNLAFKDLSYTQSTEEGAGLRMTLVKVDGQTVLRVDNQTREELQGLTAIGPGETQFFGDPIPPGKSVDLRVGKAVSSHEGDKQQTYQSWSNVAANLPNHLLVLASQPSMQIGPSYGLRHPSSSFSVVEAPQWGAP
ncbi:MAG: hypothetical protein JST12_05075 [Armatimonadetes bacterium]|nr:hypothetical protein [Armatimonadota bacterium]MBS1727833.1 hypothetical protein [Armatimonadota bacterium]